jgi:hypothetical protein
MKVKPERELLLEKNKRWAKILWSKCKSIRQTAGVKTKQLELFKD